ncbi:MAG: GNAT family N-acetyltransferase [Anaerolineaceae bacterium]|nr:GNAT family N-acetyltransferase [Anaerolineaceae bacterium]
MTIEYWQDVDDSVWVQLAEQCEYATFFNTPAWFHLAKDLVSGSQIKIIGGQTSQGTQFVLPVAIEKQMGPFYRLTSSLNGVYGGIIADGPLNESECQQIYQNLVSKWRVLTYTFTPSPLRHASAGLSNFLELNDKTYLISLAPGYEEIYRNYSRGHKSAINKAIKSDVQVEVTTALDDYRAYYQVYKDSLDRWGETFFGYTLPWTFFEKIHGLALQKSDNVKLWVARLGNEVIAGAIVFYWHKCVNYFHGANHRDYFNYRAANLVQNEIIKHAAQPELNFATYDFGPSGIESLYEFKRRFGGEELPTQYFSYSHPLFNAYNNLRAKLPR